MDLNRVHRHMPDLVSRASDIGQGWHSAGRSEIPAHVRCTWRERDGAEVVERVWAMVTAWTSLAMRVHMWRHGEWHVWVRREDVEPCRCIELHIPGWWPVDDASATGAVLCTMPS